MSLSQSVVHVMASLQPWFSMQSMVRAVLNTNPRVFVTHNSGSSSRYGSKLIGHLRSRQFGAHVHTGNDVLDRSTLHTVALTFAVNR